MVKSLLRTFDQRLTKGRLFLLRHGVVGKRYRKIQQMNKNPVLIGGCGRSGTSLLLSLLSAHSRIYAIPHETQAFCPGGYSEIDLTGAFQINLVYSHFLNEKPLLENHDRWCEKTPKNIHFAERILDYFGSEARFIHLVRDGRDVVTSRHPSDPTKYWVLPARWVKDVRAGRTVDEHPRVLTVRYEDLTTHPLPELRRLCAFLDEPFEEERFQAYPASAQFSTGDFFRLATDNVDSESDGGGVHTRSVKRWKKEEHAPVVNQLIRLDGARELLKHYGYLEEN